MLKNTTRRVEEITVGNMAGLHARVSTVLAKKAMEFTSAVHYQKQGERRIADGRSVLDLLSLGAAKGDRLRIEVDGADADAAMNAILALFEDHFGEEAPV